MALLGNKLLADNFCRLLSTKVPTTCPALNSWIKSHGYVYVDFYSAMVDARGGLPATLSKDGVHPTLAGYAVMIAD